MSGGEWRVHGVPVRVVSEVNSNEYDALVLVLTAAVPPLAPLKDFVAAVRKVDAAIDKNVTVLPCPHVSGGRVILSGTGPITHYDDVRSVAEASLAGMRRAIASGALKPVVALQPHPSWPAAELVTLLGALETLYVPLQIRESFPHRGHNIAALGVYGEGVRLPMEQLVKEATALEVSRGVVRDIAGADPERMTAMNTARYLTDLFQGSDVSVRVIDNADTIKKEYPLFAAVNRAAAAVERHRGCVVFLEYAPKSYDRTVMLVGKGVTYDTGGCDVKAGGVMAGMSRDKCGAAACAGFVKACEVLKPNLKVVAALGMVRNSIGECAYVADELIRCRRGLAVRVGNTDAEGRMVMGDLLAEMVERARGEKSPHIYTIATLTGHVIRAYGSEYTGALDNHVAREAGHARCLQAAGERVADLLEVSIIRREDIAEHRGKVPGDQVHQAPNLASALMPRGHQAPAGFLLLVSGLDEENVRYTHLDVAGSAGLMPTPPTAAPLVALAAHYGLITCGLECTCPHGPQPDHGAKN